MDVSRVCAHENPHLENSPDLSPVEMLRTMAIWSLQEVLDYAGYQDTLSRKSDLLEWCIQLIHQDNPHFNIEEKIREVYMRSTCRQMDIPRPVIRRNRQAPMTSKFPLRPDIKFTELPFYDHVDQLVAPLALYGLDEVKAAAASGIPVHTSSGQKVGQLQIYLTPQHANQYLMSRQWSEETKNPEYTIRIHLRFCKITDKPNDQAEDDLPPNLTILCNNRMVMLPSPKATNRPDAPVLRPPRPIDITDYVRPNPTLINTLEINWTTGTHADTPVATFCATIELVRRITVDTLINRLRQRTPFMDSVAASKALIVDKLHGSTVSTDDNASTALQFGKFRKSLIQIIVTLHANSDPVLSDVYRNTSSLRLSCPQIQSLQCSVSSQEQQHQNPWFNRVSTLATKQTYPALMHSVGTSSYAGQFQARVQMIGGGQGRESLCRHQQSRQNEGDEPEVITID